MSAGADTYSAPPQDTTLSTKNDRPRAEARPYAIARLSPEVLPQTQQSELARVMANLVLSTRHMERGPRAGLAMCAHPETEGLACR